MSPPSKWLRFEEVENPGKKTSRWLVLAKMDGGTLGQIKWFGAWRQYAFYPEPETIFAGSCFTDIAAFIQEAMAARAGRGAHEEGGK